MFGLGGHGKTGLAVGLRLAPGLVNNPVVDRGEGPNVLPYAYITDDSTWQESSANVSKTFGVADRNGVTRACKISLDGADNHHQWLDLAQPLSAGDDYEIRAWINPDTTEGFTGDFQLAYYDGSNNLASVDATVTPGNGWQQVTFQFTAPSAPLNDASIRILGWGNGAQGEAIIVGEVEVVNLHATYTAMLPGSGQAVAAGTEADHGIPAVQYFFTPRPEDLGLSKLWDGTPTSDVVDTVLETDFGCDMAGEGVWGTANSEIRPASESPAGFNERFLRTYIDQGQYVSSSGVRGTGWENRVIDTDHAFLTYRVRFKPGYEWVKGGKLPGLFGGDSPSGGEIADQGFSCRMMWRTDGAGELYLYAMNTPTFPPKSRGRGTFYFRSDFWHKITQEIILNDPGYDNGWARIWIDDKPIFEQRGIIFRDDPAITINGIMATIFFGGSDSTWAATRDEYVETGDFIIYSGTEVNQLVDENGNLLSTAGGNNLAGS